MIPTRLTVKMLVPEKAADDHGRELRPWSCTMYEVLCDTGVMVSCYGWHFSLPHLIFCRVNDNGSQGIKGMLEEKGQAQEETPRDTERRGRPSSTAAVPITIPVPEGSMPSKVWERLRKGGSLLGDPEERMMAEGQDGNTPGSGLVKV